MVWMSNALVPSNRDAKNTNVWTLRKTMTKTLTKNDNKLDIVHRYGRKYFDGLFARLLVYLIGILLHPQYNWTMLLHLPFLIRKVNATLNNIFSVSHGKNQVAPVDVTTTMHSFYFWTASKFRKNDMTINIKYMHIKCTLGECINVELGMANLKITGTLDKSNSLVCYLRKIMKITCKFLRWLSVIIQLIVF